MQINPDKIRDVIGSGGKIIKKIIEATGAEIDIEDDGRIFISSVDAAKGERALEIINNIVAEPEVGKIYTGKVVKVMEFGAFVELIPGVLGMSGKDGMCHISELDTKRVGKVEDVLSLGDIVKVEVLEIDPKTGKISLDRLDKPDAPASASPAPRDKGERHERRERREDNRPGRAGRTPRRRHESGSSN